jgi:lysozyme family protein
MSTLPETREELEALRAETADASQAAKAAGDEAKREKLRELLGEIDDALDDLAIANFQAMAARLAPFRARLEALTRIALAWPFGTAEAPVNHERAARAPVPENDFADEGPTAEPPVAPVAPNTIPTVSAGWSESYRQLWDTMKISPEWQKQATAIASRIVANHSRYATAVANTSTPWWFVAVVHCMECSLRFDQHLHNGDPLTARTTRVPPGRPPTGAAPFSWEESARDALVYERLDAVTDWSLESALFHWHRYNGINNEYKRRGIPTPYLWSGSQHYRKGKYVRDGVFDPEFVSTQVGAAVVLRALVDLKAVNIDATRVIESNPASASGDVATLQIDTTDKVFRHVAAELAFPGPLAKGAGTNKAEKLAVRRVQEWLCIHGCTTPIDSAFEDSTTDQLKAFQLKAGRLPTGQLDEESWVLLTTPMRKALGKIERAAQMSFEELVIAVASQHIGQNPIEVGGNNRGPWVRLYMAGLEGEEQRWCAGFVCFVVAQAARDLGVAMPFKREVGVRELVGHAKTANRFVPEAQVATLLQRRSKLKPGDIFVVRDAAGAFTHTGFLLSLNDNTFDTIEGNAGGEGGIDGPNARKGNRAYQGKDFLHPL